MSGQDLGFTHRWLPGTSGRTLLLLHGTGGDENDLIPLAKQLAPNDNLLSPRGKVMEMGAPRFFRRHGAGLLDLEDLQVRTQELADFVVRASGAYAFDPEQVVAIGFSNGANIAVGLLFERPEVLAGAVLMRAMLPYEPKHPPALAQCRVLVLAGAQDPYSHRPVSERLTGILREGGAVVEVQYANAGHGLAREDVAAAARWLANNETGGNPP